MRNPDEDKKHTFPADSEVLDFDLFKMKLGNGKSARYEFKNSMMKHFKISQNKTLGKSTAAKNKLHMRLYKDKEVKTGYRW